MAASNTCCFTSLGPGADLFMVVLATIR